MNGAAIFENVKKQPNALGQVSVKSGRPVSSGWSSGTFNGELGIQFGGQGNSYWEELSRLYRRRDLAEFFDTALEAYFRALSPAHEKSSGSVPDAVLGGIQVVEPAAIESALLTGHEPEFSERIDVSLPLLFITQLAYIHSHSAHGLSPADLAPVCRGITGHSQGLITAVVFSILASGKHAELPVYAEFIEWFTTIARTIEHGYQPGILSGELAEQMAWLELDKPSCMAAITGLSQEAIASAVQKTNASLDANDKIWHSLINGPASHVVCGGRQGLASLRIYLQNSIAQGGARWTFLPLHFPFHTPTALDFMEDALAAANHDHLSKQYTGRDLTLPVYWAEEEGKVNDLQQSKDMLTDAVMAVFVNKVHWPTAVDKVSRGESGSPIQGWVDFGPGRTSSGMTKKLYPDSAVGVYQLNRKAGLRAFLG